MLCHVALTEIMEIRLKAVELLLALPPMRTPDCSDIRLSRCFLTNIDPSYDGCPPFEAGEALEAVKNIILVKKDIRKNLVSEGSILCL